MTESVSLDAALTILGMAAVTYGLRAGGLLLADRLPKEGRIAVALDRLPALVLISLIAPSVVDLGAVGFVAAAVAAALMLSSRSVLLAVVGGAATVASARWLAGG